MKTREEILKILRTGNFTIYFHDSDPGAWAIYNTFVDDTEIEDWDEFDAAHKIYEEPYDTSVGYAPGIVILLADALGGKVESV